jgi:hypothetical protein
MLDDLGADPEAEPSNGPETDPEVEISNELGADPEGDFKCARDSKEEPKPKTETTEMIRIR